jgi:hypothetical protein
VIGISRKTFGPIPLPLLFPGSATDVTGPCNLYVSVDFVIPLATDSSGRATLNFPIPADPAFAGFTLNGQWLVPDTGAGNMFGLIASDGVQWNWVAPYTMAPVSTVYATNTLSQTGSLSSNHGLVAQLW